MVNLSDTGPRSFKLCARSLRRVRLRGSLLGCAARRRLRPTFSLASLYFRVRTSALLHHTTAPQPLATLQNSLSGSLIRIHNDFGFWILDFGLTNGIEMIQWLLSFQSKIQNLKSKIVSVAPDELYANSLSGFHFCASRRRLSQGAALAARLHL